MTWEMVDGIKNVIISVIHNVNLCVGSGSPLLRLAIFHTGLAKRK